MLDHPAGDVLAEFRDNQGAVSFWFTVLALSAALLAPIAVGVGRLASNRAMRASPFRSGSQPRSCRSSASCAGRSSFPVTRADAANADPSVAHSARDTFTTAGQRARYRDR